MDETKIPVNVYKPTNEEIKQAEIMMSPEQKDLSELRMLKAEFEERRGQPTLEQREIMSALTNDTQMPFEQLNEDVKKNIQDSINKYFDLSKPYYYPGSLMVSSADIGIENALYFFRVSSIVNKEHINKETEKFILDGIINKFLDKASESDPDSGGKKVYYGDYDRAWDIERAGNFYNDLGYPRDSLLYYQKAMEISGNSLRDDSKKAVETSVRRRMDFVLENYKDQLAVNAIEPDPIIERFILDRWDFELKNAKKEISYSKVRNISFTTDWWINYLSRLADTCKLSDAKKQAMISYLRKANESRWAGGLGD